MHAFIFYIINETQLFCILTFFKRCVYNGTLTVVNLQWDKTNITFGVTDKSPCELLRVFAQRHVMLSIFNRTESSESTPHQIHY